MKSISVICWWALAIVFFTETVKSASNTDVDNTNYRLPNETYPEHYNIELTTYCYSGEKAFNGEVTIDIVVVSTTSKIVLHAGKLEISKATIVNAITGESEDLSTAYELRREFLTLTRLSGEKFSAETKWKLRIIYNGELRDDYVGFYLYDHYYAATNFKTNYARHAFPCYDEPDKRAKFTIKINHSPNYKAISNMPVNGKLSRAGQTVFLTTPSMPTFSVAFMVCDFQYTEVKYNNISIRAYWSNSYFHEEFLNTTKQIMNYVSDYFDVEYMLPKIDHVVVPVFRKDSIANWGLIMYDSRKFQKILFHNYDTVKYMAQVIFQQWFGNYVTISSWAYLWITEGMANLYANKALDHIYPEWNTWEMYEMDSLPSTLEFDSYTLSIVLTNYVQTPKEIDDNLTPKFYYKSTYTLRMWKNALTDKVFQKGLRNFLKRNQYKAVGEKELFNALQSAAKEENYQLPATINEMISSWTNQKGYPILTVSRNYNDGTFTIKQETYYFNKTMKDSKTWYVPINYAVASNPNFSDTKATHYLRNVTEMSFTDVRISNKDWLILNKQAVGYYRVNYDKRNWNLIIKSLIENPLRIHKRNRAQLVRDAIELFESNRLHVSVLFKLFTYFKQEEDHICWLKLVNYFYVMDNHLKTNENYDGFKSFFAELVSPIYEKLRLIDEPRDNDNKNDIRHLINRMACAVEINKCLEPDYIILKYALIKNKTLTHKELTCNAMKMADDELFNTLYQKLIDKEDKTSKFNLINALSCIKSVTLFKKLLKVSTDKSIYLTNNGRTYVLDISCLNSEMTFSACIEFLDKNWNAYGRLDTVTGDYNPLNEQIIRMAYGVTNKQQKDELLVVLNKVKKSKYVLPTLKRTVKKIIRKSLKLKKKYVKKVGPWVAKYRTKAMQTSSGMK